MPYDIHQLNVGMANVYFLRGTAKTLVIDSGQAGQGARIANALTRWGVNGGGASLLFITHAHIDHTGSAQDLKTRLGVPLAIHPAEEERLTTGTMGVIQPIGFEARLLYPFVNASFPTATADRLLDEATDLGAYGVGGQVVHTPGHTSGSLTLLTDAGDAFIGDLLRGGALGGYVMSGVPKYPYFVGDVEKDKQTVRASVQKLLDLGARRFFVGHGGPLTRAAVERWLSDNR